MLSYRRTGLPLNGSGRRAERRPQEVDVQQVLRAQDQVWCGEGHCALPQRRRKGPRHVQAPPPQHARVPPLFKVLHVARGHRELAALRARQAEP